MILKGYVFDFSISRRRNTDLVIVLFKSLRNSERRNKGNFTSKSNSNKINLCGGGVQHYLVLNKISTIQFHFLGIFTISK